MPEHAAVLFANDAFYLAFCNRDLDAMDAIWARETPITCNHPGWDPLSDRDEVMGVRSEDGMVEGVQFHPESILTEEGKNLLGNVLRMAG